MICTDINNRGLDILIPVKSIGIHPSNHPWLNIHSKSLINRRQKACYHFRILRNIFSGERKLCRHCIIKINSRFIQNQTKEVVKED